MFLHLPNTKWNGRKKEWVHGHVLINPFHIISIEKDDEDPKCSVLLMVSDVTYYIRMTPEGLRKKVDEFVKENVLTKIYSDLKDKQN